MNQLREAGDTPDNPPRRFVPSWVFLLLAVVVAFLSGSWVLQHHGVPREAAFMAGIFVLAAILWATGALPLFATSLLVIGLEALLLANPGGWEGLGFESRPSPSYRDILKDAADPVLVLFFGGFILAHAAVKVGLDRAMSALLLKPFGGHPRWVLLGLMLVTSLFGMWMSNTATATMMLALITPMLVSLPPREPFRKALVLGIPFSANISGMSTPIASPPNAVALGYLRESGHDVAFLDWMLVAVPLALGLTLVTWVILWRMFRPNSGDLRLTPAGEPITGRAWLVVGVFLVTVTLWMSDRQHGLPPALVALLPAIVLTATGVFTSDDLKRLEWRILILIGGGIALGSGMERTGLDKVIAQSLPVSADNGFWLLTSVVAAVLVVGTFISNTAAANLFLPIGLSAAAATGPGGIHPVHMALSIAFAASMSMALPISTPPNALAHATGEVTTREMARAAQLVSGLAAIVILGGGGFIMRFWGILK